MNNSSVDQKKSLPNLVMTVSDGALGEIGYLVVDRTVAGSASGGTRFAQDVSIAELASLARSMTYKWAFLNVPMGGAKAGIFADPGQLGCKRSELMEAFGRGIASLVQRNVYYPGIDLGTTPDDLHGIMQGAGTVLVGEQIDGSYATALTVFETIRQVSNFCGKDLNGLRVALEGFGKVGSSVGVMLQNAGARLIAISTVAGAVTSRDGFDVQGLLQLKRLYGDDFVHHFAGSEVIHPEELFTLDVDLLIPGARPWAINEDNVGEVNARWIVPISNAPITITAESQLNEKGALIVPDFVSNCGGILSMAMRSDYFDLDDVNKLISNSFADMVYKMLTKSAKRGVNFSHFAREIAWRNHLKLTSPKQRANGTRKKASQLILSKDWEGIKRRIAYRAHRRQSRLEGSFHQSALERYAEITLGEVIQQMETMENEADWGD
jgi:glutamate dehydrogenase (NAD(P)+)